MLIADSRRTMSLIAWELVPLISVESAVILSILRTIASLQAKIPAASVV